MSLLNTEGWIYRQIARIAAVQRANEALRFSRMYYREIFGDGAGFGLPYGTAYTLAFSRLLYPREVLVAYDVSDQPRADCITVDAAFHQAHERMNFLYGGAGSVEIEPAPDGRLYVRPELGPHQFVILE